MNHESPGLAWYTSLQVGDHPRPTESVHERLDVYRAAVELLVLPDANVGSRGRT